MFTVEDGNIILNLILVWGVRIVAALLIFFVGRWVSGVITRFVDGFMRRRQVDDMLVKFAGSILYAILMLLVIVGALDQLGVNTTSLIALIGAAGLAVGLALQDSMQNFASGVLLIFFRPFRVGDYVEAAGIAGSVERITIFTTVLVTPDNREIIVPNHQIYSGSITNYSAKETRRVDLVFGIGYGDDLRKAKELLQNIVHADERVLDEPAPVIAVAELADSSVNFNVRPWVKSEDYWAVRADLTEQVKLAFDDHGISIPFPQMDVHVEQVA